RTPRRKGNQDAGFDRCSRGTAPGAPASPSTAELTRRREGCPRFSSLQTTTADTRARAPAWGSSRSGDAKRHHVGERGDGQYELGLRTNGKPFAAAPTAGAPRPRLRRGLPPTRNGEPRPDACSIAGTCLRGTWSVTPPPRER